MISLDLTWVNLSVAQAVGRLEGEVIRAMKEIDQKSDGQMGSWRYLWEIEKENDLSRQELDSVSFSVILMRSFLGKITNRWEYLSVW